MTRNTNGGPVFGELKLKKVIDGELVVINITLDATVASQSADLSLTGEVYERKGYGWAREPHSCGQCQGRYKAHFPEVAKFNKWHMCHVDRGPWYYIENTRYWFDGYL